jgi:putative membrane protein
MHTILRTIAVAAIASLISVAARGPAAEESAGPRVASKDQQFMTTAAHGGHLEVTAGNLAAAKATNGDVKKFGRQMVQDHGKASEELKRIAQAKGVTLPEEPDAKQKDLLKKLEAAQGPDFDRLYITEAGVKDHEADVVLFTDQATNGTDADVKAFAAKTLPMIKEHYQMAQDLAKSGDAPTP